MTFNRTVKQICRKHNRRQLTVHEVTVLPPERCEQDLVSPFVDPLSQEEGRHCCQPCGGAGIFLEAEGN